MAELQAKLARNAGSKTTILEDHAIAFEV